MFKTRQPSAAAPAPNPPTVEWVRQRAKHRLLGVGALVLAGVLLFPMLFDTQPRPIPVDIAIEIPSRQSAPPLLATPLEGRPALGEGPAAVSPESARAAPTAGRAAGSTVSPQEEVIAGSESALRVQESSSVPPRESRPVPAPVPALTPAPSPAPVPKPTPAPVPKPAPAPVPAPFASSAGVAEADRARALLEGRPMASAKSAAAADAAATPNGQRFIVQVGAFADSARAQQVRNDLERVGLKTYTHVADTPQGKRIRVRLGPFATRAEADKAAAKAKTTGVPAAILTL